jgi:hypothetical protein
VSVPALRLRPAWAALEKHYHSIKDIPIGRLFAEDRERGERLAVEAAGIYLDYSKNRIVIASWLLDLSAAALMKDPALSNFAGRVSDSGEGRWTLIAAIDEGVPTHVLSSALYERFSSRGDADFADKLLSAMRYEFGGHLEKPMGS